MKLLLKFLARLLAAAALVLGTFNPTGYSYFDWIAHAGDGPWLLKLMVGVALVIAYTAVLSIVLTALRRSGLFAGMLVGALLVIQFSLWLLPSSHFASLRGDLVLAEYVVLLAFSIALGVGLSWSFLVAQLSGQQQKRYVAGGTPPLLPPLLR